MDNLCGRQRRVSLINLHFGKRVPSKRSMLFRQKKQKQRLGSRQTNNFWRFYIVIKMLLAIIRELQEAKRRRKLKVGAESWTPKTLSGECPGMADFDPEVDIWVQCFAPQFAQTSVTNPSRDWESCLTKSLAISGPQWEDRKYLAPHFFLIIFRHWYRVTIRGFNHAGYVLTLVCITLTPKEHEYVQHCDHFARNEREVSERVIVIDVQQKMKGTQLLATRVHEDP